MIQAGEIGEPDEKFYCNIIAQVILFQQCDKIVDAQNFGGYKAQINYYTIALLSEYYSNKVDFSYIWQHQSISPEVSQLIEDICYKVGYSNVGYFYKVFRKLCGKSPKTYRLQVMTEHVEDE